MRALSVQLKRAPDDTLAVGRLAMNTGQTCISVPLATGLIIEPTLRATAAFCEQVNRGWAQCRGAAG